MFGSWVRKQVADAMYEHSMSGKNEATRLGLYGESSKSYISVHAISNGYLLQVNSGSLGGPAIVYCKDQQEISDQIITLHARERMGIPSNVKVGPLKSSGPAQSSI
jgi:hypothetical protein